MTEARIGSVSSGGATRHWSATFSNLPPAACSAMSDAHCRQARTKAHLYTGALEWVGEGVVARAEHWAVGASRGAQVARGCVRTEEDGSRVAHIHQKQRPPAPPAVAAASASAARRCRVALGHGRALGTRRRVVGLGRVRRRRGGEAARRGRRRGTTHLVVVRDELREVHLAGRVVDRPFRSGLRHGARSGEQHRRRRCLGAPQP
jgi:hypothetical protein